MKPLLNASTLILVTKNHLIKNSIRKANDVNTLTLKRSKTTSFLPNFHVFPGGYCDPADESSHWLNIFPSSELDVELNMLNKHEDSSTSANERIPKAISLRITAIRETFEECGILLCKREADKLKFSATHYEVPETDHWRLKIRNDAKEFYNFCRTFHCFPDIKSLHLLSNWLTPYFFPRRFDSKIFIATLDSQIEVKPDYQEIQEAQWNSVEYFLNTENIILPPPQVYELQKLQNFTNFVELEEYIGNLDSKICTPYLPVRVGTVDGFILILPGDENYEKLLEQQSEITTDLDCDNVSYRGKVMNRIEYKNTDKDGHWADEVQVVVTGLNQELNSFSSKNRSKL